MDDTFCITIYRQPGIGDSEYGLSQDELRLTGALLVATHSQWVMYLASSMELRRGLNEKID